MEKTEKILCDLIEIDSQEGKEKRLGDYIKRLFESRGYEVFEQRVPNKEDSSQERYNILIKKGDPKVFFFGHLDTVKIGNLENWTATHPLKPKKIENKIYGLGSVDMKAGISAAISSILEKGPENIGLCLTCDEEYLFAGIKRILEEDFLNGINPELAIFCEPTDLKIVNTHKGCLEMDLRVKGQSAHSTRPEEGKDASELYLCLKNVKSFLEENFEDIHFNIGYFSSGEEGKINKIPDNARAVVDIRPSKDLVLKGKEYILNLLKNELDSRGLKLADYNINIDLKPLDVGSHKLKRFREIVQNMGVETEFSDLGGASEAGEINFNYNFPCINFGPGPSKMGHKDNEYVYADSLKKLKTIYSKIISEFN